MDQFHTKYVLHVYILDTCSIRFMNLRVSGQCLFTIAQLTRAHTLFTFYTNHLVK